jgi:hypothetical protein
MLKIIGSLLLFAIVIVLVLAALKPATFHIERRTVVNAPAEKIFPYLNDFRTWTVWSPWERKDPSMRREYGSSTSGVGATYAWNGDKNVGQGNMRIVESVFPSRLLIALNFIKPIEAHNTATFILTPVPGATEVTWSMDGPNTFVGKVFQVFLAMDKMVGPDFEAGLASLKAAAERT